MKKIILIAAFLGLIILSTSCKSVKDAETRNVEDIYKSALELYTDEDYLEAKNLFDLIKLQYPASQYADDAQYYLAEINYARGEYYLAAFNYNLLRRIYPGSDYNKISLFKTGLSYYKESPSFDRDQEYTKKAIQTFQEFQYLFAGDSLYTQAGDYISELRDKLAQRDYSTAVLYKKLDSPISALVYYNSVINDFNDTKYFEPAIFEKIETLVWVKKYDEAKATIELYKKLFPKGKWINDAVQIASQINKQ